MTYYATKASPKLDMIRHKRDEAILREKIRELEEKPTRDAWDEAILMAYQRGLNALLDSLMILTERIGKK